MGIYKVSIFVEGGKIIFKVADVILTYIEKVDNGYILTVNGNVYPTFSNLNDAIEKSKERITIYFNSLGIKPDFHIIDESLSNF